MNRPSLDALLRKLDLFSLVAVIAFSAIVAALHVALVAPLQRERQQLRRLELRGAALSATGEVTENMAILASSTAFYDYIRSGPQSRKRLAVDFEYLFTHFNGRVEGHQVFNARGELVYGSPEASSNNSITTEVCYLDGRLDPELGQCVGVWRVFLPDDFLTVQLKRRLPGYAPCPECQDSRLDVTEFTSPALRILRFHGMRFVIDRSPSNLGFVYVFEAAVLLGFLLLIFSLRYEVRGTLRASLIGPMRTLIANLSPDVSQPLEAGGLAELAVLDEKLRAFKADVRTLEAERSNIAIGKLSAQVAHDIRSPLTALSLAAGQASLAPRDRELIASAVARIEAISRDLSERKTPGSAPRRPQLLAALIGPILGEKRAEWAGKTGLTLEAGPFPYGLFAEVDPVEFERALSNLLNNAVEAVAGRGRVSVSLTQNGGRCLLSVQDDGPGIPRDVLPRLGERGATFAKPGGTGLGLFHAKTSARAWGGELELRSAPGQGATVTLVLPLCRPPACFLFELRLRPGAPVIVVDDDPSVHALWKSRLGAIESLRSAQELRGRAGALKGPAFFLVDQELGAGESGLDLIESLGLSGRSALVTGRFADPAVIERCVRLKVGLLPKLLACEVPIAAGAADAVLIDDDALVQAVWRIAAKSKGKSLCVFSGEETFLAQAAGFEAATPIYIDSQLQGPRRGEDLARELHERGFSRLYLCTGHAPESFPSMPWIEKVVGKEAPWA